MYALSSAYNVLLQVKLQELVLDNLFDLPALTEYELFSMGRGPYR